MKEMFLRAILTVDETMNTVTMILSIVSGILAIVAEFKIRSRRNKKSWVIKLIIIVSIIVVTCTVVRKNITQVPDIVGKTYSDACNILSNNDLSYNLVLDNGIYVMEQDPVAGTIVKRNSRVELVTEPIGNNAEVKRIWEESLDVSYGNIAVTFKDTNIILEDSGKTVQCYGNVLEDYTVKKAYLLEETVGVEYHDYILDDSVMIFKNIPQGIPFKLIVLLEGYEEASTEVTISSQNMEGGTYHFTWATHILGVPTHYAKLFESKRLKNKDLSFLKIVGVGGDSLSVEMEKRIEEYLHMHGANITVATGYGMTEVSAAACGFHKNAYKVGSVGIPFLNTIIRITNIETLEEQSYNEQGEIWISSPTAMLGYDNNEEETKRVVYTDANGVKWIRSGDIGHMDEQGFLYIDGRIKRIIIRHDGFKVFPTQIENVIATCPEVKTCCAIGRADKDHSQGKLPVVYITLSREKKDKMKLKEELNSLCKQMLPEYMQPIDFVFIDKMPLTANGKVDFHELEGIELSNRL